MFQAIRTDTLSKIWILLLLLGAAPYAHASGDLRLIYAAAWNCLLLIAAFTLTLLVRARSGTKLLKGVLILLWLAINLYLWNLPGPSVSVLTVFLSPLVLIAIALIRDKK